MTFLQDIRKLAWVAMVLWAMPGRAQSHDPKSPTPLGPGVNKGNVDNVTGAVYYSFQGGPGRVTMNFGFKSLGIFGNPLKESLSFDIYEIGKFLSHSVIVSTDKMERIAPAGDVLAPHLFTIYLIPQQAAIRMGGYYEIEITGAVGFGAAKATGEGAKPVDTRLTNGPVALTNGPVALTNGPVALTNGPVKLTDGPVALTVQESPREVRLYIAADVLFDFDKSTIRPDASKTLRQVAEIIRAKSRGAVRVEGFTDSKGDAAYNARLSEQRAASVKEWLVSKEGLSAAMTTRGFGAANPVAPNAKPDGSDDPAGRQKNRRVEILISK